MERNWFFESALPRIWMLAAMLLVAFLLWVINENYKAIEDIYVYRITPLKMIIQMQKAVSDLNANAQDLTAEQSPVDKKYRLQRIDRSINQMQNILEEAENLSKSEQGKRLFSELKELCSANIVLGKEVMALAAQGKYEKVKEIQKYMAENTANILVILDKLVLVIEIRAAEKMADNKILTLTSQISSFLGLLLLLIARTAGGKNISLKDIGAMMKTSGKETVNKE
ncbi:MCP four helix bundle domain-containing protein [Thermosyntropha sp.]|uniref:MCP four helix bundle domain-containing protein n=1 Tax=Thermosyntropha sp. TaxID=2740820 RepID=UPI0025F6151D|nr:MCP four helix bundle domain-containing protein [Thermosyntropha sp.]MBO8159632.1 MCP four helix bundle domain-containing protein [Thermosyntropha sp.]